VGALSFQGVSKLKENQLFSILVHQSEVFIGLINSLQKFSVTPT